MADVTTIQWADSTVNPIMGCGGCELFPPPGQILKAIDDAVDSALGIRIDSRELFKSLVDDVFLRSKPGFSRPSHKKVVSTTNIWHLRERFGERILGDHGKAAAKVADDAIQVAVTCYAAILHFNKGENILDREGILRPGKTEPRKPHKGHAPIFEAVTRFEGRSAETAHLDDLFGVERPSAPWKGRLPRLIFVSDMGDAFSRPSDFDFLRKDLMPAIESDDGKRHLWMWLTKRPELMDRFAGVIGGFPKNVCAMTTLTGPDKESIGRLAALKKVDASVRGLSIEPLWARIPPSELDLGEIDWVILGGESGSGDLTRPFDVAWAVEMREHCRKSGVAFFMKQLGTKPVENDTVLKLNDKHGGEWEEWEDSLRVREFPRAFHDYRQGDRIRPNVKRRRKKETLPAPEALLPAAVDTDREDFARLDEVVRRGVRAFIECGKALAEIHDRELWRLVPGATWEGYCRDVVGMSKPHAHRLVEASRIAIELTASLPIGNDATFPVSESQVRPLGKLKTPEARMKAWERSVEIAGGQPTALEVVEAVFEVLAPDRSTEEKQTRSQQRVALLTRLKFVIQERKSWDEVEQIIREFEELC